MRANQMGMKYQSSSPRPFSATKCPTFPFLLILAFKNSQILNINQNISLIYTSLVLFGLSVQFHHCLLRLFQMHITQTSLENLCHVFALSQKLWSTYFGTQYTEYQILCLQSEGFGAYILEFKNQKKQSYIKQEFT